MSFFEKELRETFGYVSHIVEKRYFGKTMMGNLDSTPGILVKMSHLKEDKSTEDCHNYEKYVGYLIEVIDRKTGLIDSQSFLYEDFDKGVHTDILGTTFIYPYIIFYPKYDDKAKWYCQIGNQERHNMITAISTYLSFFIEKEKKGE